MLQPLYERLDDCLSEAGFDEDDRTAILDAIRPELGEHVIELKYSDPPIGGCIGPIRNDVHGLQVMSELVDAMLSANDAKCSGSWSNQPLVDPDEMRRRILTPCGECQHMQAVHSPAGCRLCTCQERIR